MEDVDEVEEVEEVGRATQIASPAEELVTRVARLLGLLEGEGDVVDGVEVGIERLDDRSEHHGKVVDDIGASASAASSVAVREWIVQGVRQAWSCGV